LSAARAILQTVGNFGTPLTIRSDGGGEFINDTLAALEAIIGSKHHKVVPYLHEGNSLAEKANRAVLENLRNRVLHPVVLFYPGQRDGPAGLRFMDELDADHNYRPKLFA
jgi:hypothetical protein